MKTLLTSLLLSAVALTATAQTLRIHRGDVTVAIPAAQVGDMHFSAATLTVMGETYDLATVDSITVTADEVTPTTVGVTYDGTRAHVTLAGDIAPQITATVSGADVRLIAAADLQQEVTYTLSGTSDNGSFYMDGDYKATLCLNNLTLTSTTGAPLTIDNGKRINVELPDGTTTTLLDAAGGSQKACFFVNGHPEFTGGGTLNITGRSRHAFASDEYTLLRSGFGQLNILGAVSDGLHIGQYFRMKGGQLHVSGVQGDGVDVSATKDAADEYNGQVFIEGGEVSLDVTAEDVKGIKCDSLMTVSGGTITANIATTANGSKGFSVGGNLIVNEASGQATTITMTVAATTYKSGTADESKCRGIKVKGDFIFGGGTIVMTVSGNKAKGIAFDGDYIHTGGTYTKNNNVIEPGTE